MISAVDVFIIMFVFIFFVGDYNVCRFNLGYRLGSIDDIFY